MSTDLTGLIPFGWGGGEAVTKWWRGKHIHLYRLRKNCAQCQKEMILDVTKAAIMGTAKNAGLHLTRCPGCRGASKSEGATSRPFTRGEPETAPATTAPAEDFDNAELASLRAQNDMFVKSITALQAQIQPLKAEIHALKLKLAAFDLPTAMAAAKPKTVLIPSPFRNEEAITKKLPWQ